MENMITVKVHCPNCKQQTVTLLCCTQNDGSIHPTTYVEKSQDCKCSITGFEMDTVCFKEAKEIDREHRRASKCQT